MPAPTQTAAPAAPPSAFDAEFLLLAVKTHCPEFRVRLDAVRYELAGQEIDPKEVRSRAELLPDDLRESLAAAFRGVAAVREARTLPFYGLKGIRVLPRAAAAGFFAEFDAARSEMDAALERGFFPLYEDRVRLRARDYWGPKLGGAYEARIGRHLPPLATLRRRVGVEAIRFSLTFDQAADADAALADLAGTIRDRLADAVESLRDRLATGRKLSAGTFNDLREAIGTLRGFSAFADARLAREVDEVAARVDAADAAARAARTIAGASMTAAIRGVAGPLSAGLDALLEACRDRGGVDAAVGRFGGVRRIRVLEPDA